MSQSSDVERQLSALSRSLITASNDYQSARDRLFAAQMGQAMETQSKGERFTLVEPPDLPLMPSSPNRPVLLALLIILVLATGFGWPQVAESMDGSINSARAVERVQGSPPLAEIPAHPDRHRQDAQAQRAPERAGGRTGRACHRGGAGALLLDQSRRAVVRGAAAPRHVTARRRADRYGTNSQSA